MAEQIVVRYMERPWCVNILGDNTVLVLVLLMKYSKNVI